MSGFSFTERGAKRIVSAVRQVESRPVDRVGQARSPRGVTSQTLSGNLVAVYDDYITINVVNAEGEETGTIKAVAKTPTLHHNAAEYPEVSSLTRESSTATTASGSGDDEDWEVRPLYATGRLIHAIRVTYTGVEDGSGNKIRWVEVSPRGWHVVTEDTEIQT